MSSGKLLNCGVHTCPHRCHQLQDHSKMDCKATVSSVCPNKHKVRRACHDKAAATCRTCEAELRAQEKKRRRDRKLDEERQTRQRAYAARLAEIQDEIEHQKQDLKDAADERDRQQTIEQKKQDLRNLKAKAKHPPKQCSPSFPSQSSGQASGDALAPQKVYITPKDPQADHHGVDTDSQSPAPDRKESRPDWDKSGSKDDWEWQKEFEGAENEALDLLVSMIGTLAQTCIVHILTYFRTRIRQATVSRYQGES
jgi:hypothetical protein